MHYKNSYIHLQSHCPAFQLSPTSSLELQLPSRSDCAEPVSTGLGRTVLQAPYCRPLHGPVWGKCGAVNYSKKGTRCLPCCPTCSALADGHNRVAQEQRQAPRLDWAAGVSQEPRLQDASQEFHPLNAVVIWGSCPQQPSPYSDCSRFCSCQEVCKRSQNLCSSRSVPKGLPEL